MLCVLVGGVGVWFWSSQRLAVQRALLAERQARDMAESARAQALAAQSQALAARAQALADRPGAEDLNALVPATPDAEQILTPTEAGNGPSLEPLDWLAGSWSGESEKQTTEEVWLAPRGGVMLGLNRSTGEPEKASYVYLRIQSTVDGITYFARPMGEQETAFPMKSMTPGEVVFENPSHDFPQRITYRLNAEQLQVEIEGVVAGESRTQQWRFINMKDEHVDSTN